ncbi:hypothetical protein AK812_SmicGene19759 [Symbiodinium microadriaticum]|uniref:Uncharacterized protein n=1 Tax=Symbiodinium microadriaticum TaxID=2951 RepID=A0A1Q9DRR0_SYMMI|nr:hypothetical protein AK812_SmicGene19759 [Symbiodinium microadriaticum]
MEFPNNDTTMQAKCWDPSSAKGLWEMDRNRAQHKTISTILQGQDEQQQQRQQRQQQQQQQNEVAEDEEDEEEEEE